MCDYYYRYHERWTDEEERMLFKLKKQGLTWNEIASKIVGRSEIACRVHYTQKTKHNYSLVSEKEESKQKQINISGVKLVNGKLVFV